MEELTKANHSVMKLGGEAVAREATMVELEHQLAHWKEWTNKSVERVNNLDRENIKQRIEIAKLKQEVRELDKELEASRMKVDSLKT